MVDSISKKLNTQVFLEVLWTDSLPPRKSKKTKKWQKNPFFCLFYLTYKHTLKAALWFLAFWFIGRQERSQLGLWLRKKILTLCMCVFSIFQPVCKPSIKWSHVALSPAPHQIGVLWGIIMWQQKKFCGTTLPQERIWLTTNCLLNPAGV